MGDLTMKWLLIWKSEFLNSIHTLASKNLKDFWHVSINCIHIFNRLELKGNPASDEVEKLFAKILPVDPSVQQTDTQKDGKNFKTTWISAVFNSITSSAFGSVAQQVVQYGDCVSAASPFPDPMKTSVGPHFVGQKRKRSSDVLEATIIRGYEWAPNC